MDKLDKLIQEILRDEVIIRFKELDIIIDEKFKIDFSKLLQLQKEMVQKREAKSNDYDSTKKLYEKEKQKFSENILVSEYIELIDYINYDLSLIQNIISGEIAIDFE